MSVRFAWVLNLDAELELAQRSYAPRARVTEQLALYGRDSRRLLGPNDALISGPAPTSAPLEPSAGFLGRAWCPTPRALSRFASAGVEPEPHPEPSVLRRVNHRRFAHELGGGLPGQRYLQSRDELGQVLRDATTPLLLKRPLAFAGRGQQRVYAHSKLTDKERSWIAASLRDDGLIVEPLVEPLLEVSVHGFIWRDGRHELGLACVQSVSDRGVFREIRRARAGELSDDELEALLERATATASALFEAGYFGPFGIDAYRHRAGFCALSEINARYSMGFVTGFPRPPHELML